MMGQKTMHKTNLTSFQSTGNLKGCRLRFTPKTNKKVIEWNYTYRGQRKSLDLIDFNLELDRGINQK